MPGFDGTGPQGLGPMTGGGRGFCALPAGAAARPAGAFGAGAVGYGMGRGRRGGGRGYRNWFYATGMPGWARAQAGMPAFGGANFSASVADEKAFLKQRADYLKSELEALEVRIKSLEEDSRPKETK